MIFMLEYRSAVHDLVSAQILCTKSYRLILGLGVVLRFIVWCRILEG